MFQTFLNDVDSIVPFVILICNGIYGFCTLIKYFEDIISDFGVKQFIEVCEHPKELVFTAYYHLALNKKPTVRKNSYRFNEASL